MLKQKSKNNCFNIIFHVKLANQYLQLLVGSTTFSILKGTTIDLHHLEVITAPRGALTPRGASTSPLFMVVVTLPDKGIDNRAR
jgi:hypothetical protein